MPAELVTTFEGFGRTPEVVTNEVVQLMNQLDVEVGTEEANELIASHLEPASKQHQVAMLEASSEDQDEDEIVQSSSHKVFECENPQ